MINFVIIHNVEKNNNLKYVDNIQRFFQKQPQIYVLRLFFFKAIPAIHINYFC